MKWRRRSCEVEKEKDEVALVLVRRAIGKAILATPLPPKFLQSSYNK